jgi:hypothetical protein
MVASAGETNSDSHATVWPALRLNSPEIAYSRLQHFIVLKHFNSKLYNVYNFYDVL